MKTNTLNAIIAVAAVSAIAFTSVVQGAVNVDIVAISVGFLAAAGIVALTIADYRGHNLR
ncbi:hypothetical protein [Oleiharenicola lentus]|uniref:hypothetical protein n=1 Tax=Oleiharenicola lentus TaxID=2508720 RepID=UPI003F673950